MTAKVHPNVAAPSPGLGQQPAVAPGDEEPAAVTLTVWRKSLLFNCRGFTVFDARGDLVYRVDSYASDSRAEVVLMDAAGRPVLTVRRRCRKLIGLVGLGLGLSSNQWLLYRGEDEARRLPPLYAMKRAAAQSQHMRGGGGAKSVAHVAACSAGAGYEVEGSYLRRRCTVYEYDGRRRAVAEVRPSPKEAVGSDVFRLVVRPGMEVSLAMAVVLALDQMFWSS